MKINSLLAITSVVAFLLLTACVPTQSHPISDGVSDSNFILQIDRARNIVQPLTRRGSAVSVAVGVDGQLVWSQAFGYASLAKERPASISDEFRFYSLMKQLTALIALQSVLQGEIAFDTTAQEVFPELPDAFDEVTLQHLLTHTSGVRHYHHPQEAIEFGSCENAQLALYKFINDPLLHAPGTQETYSSYGFVLASAMLEARSGVPFAELVAKHLSPGTGASLQLDSRTVTGSGLEFYDVDADGETHPALPVDNSCKMGAGGFRGTAEDLVRIHNAALNGTLAPSPAINQLLGGRSSLEAGGIGVGGEAVSIIDFDSRISVVLLSNTSGLEQRMALQRARDLLLAVFDD